MVASADPAGGRQAVFVAGGEVDDAGVKLARIVLRAVEASTAFAKAPPFAEATEGRTAGKHGVAPGNQVSPDVAGEGQLASCHPGLGGG